MKRFPILYIIFLSVLAVSCKKEQMKAYSSDHFLQFTQSETDTLTLSFFFHAGKNDVDVVMPVRLVGLMPEKNLTYKIKVDAKATTAMPKNYSLSEQFEFKTGQAIDSAFVTIHKSTELLTSEYMLALEIIAANDLLPGQSSHIRKIIKINDKVSKPVWWNADMDRFYLGNYSERKFRKFMEVTGVGNLNLLTPSEQRVQMIKFKYYLIDMKAAGTPVLELDGSDMLAGVPLIG